MVETVQVNIRLSTLLVHDLEFIAQNLKIGKTEWLKVKIAEQISKERKSILEEIDNRYEKGYMDDKGYRHLTGLVPSQSMKENKEHYKKMKEKGMLGARKYIKDMMAEAAKKKKKNDDFFEDSLSGKLKDRKKERRGR